MFSKPQPAPSQNGRTTTLSIISSDMVITGTMRSDGDIHIDGRVDGNVHGANLVVGEKAEIRGEIAADSVVVRGRVEGSIRAHKVTLAKGSHVESDILHQKLEVEFGALVRGMCRHSADPLAQNLPTPTKPEDEPVETIPDRRRPGSPMRAPSQEAAEDDGLRKTG